MRELLTRDAWKKRVGKLQPGDVLPEVPGLIKTFPTEITVAKEADPETGMHDITFTISTAAIDREDDVIAVDGWDLENYLKNPVVLWGHDYGGLPVAKAMEVGTVDDKLMAVDRFTPRDVHPFGFMVYQLVRGEFLRATSVGFHPIEYVYNDDHKGYDFNRQELLEHSIVPVPANPEALVAASASGIDLAPMREWAEKLLDDPPSGRVALWLTRKTLEEVHHALSDVAVSLTDTTSTPEGDGLTEKTTEDATFDDDTEDVVKSTVGELLSEMKEQDEREESLMKEAIKALTEIVRELRGAVAELPEKIGTRLDEVAETLEAAAHPEVDAEALKVAADAAVEKAAAEAAEKDDELSADDVKAIVRAAVEEAVTAKTGRLPE